METNTRTGRLGCGDLQVSALGFGCWAIGGWGRATPDGQPLGWGEVDDEESVRAIHPARGRALRRAAVPRPGAHLAVPCEVRPHPVRGTAATSPLGMVGGVVFPKCEVPVEEMLSICRSHARMGRSDIIRLCRLSRRCRGMPGGTAAVRHLSARRPAGHSPRGSRTGSASLVGGADRAAQSLTRVPVDLGESRSDTRGPRRGGDGNRGGPNNSTARQ